MYIYGYTVISLIMFVPRTHSCQHSYLSGPKISFSPTKYEPKQPHLLPKVMTKVLLSNNNLHDAIFVEGGN